MHRDAVDFEDESNMGLAYLMPVKQLELLDALIENATQGMQLRQH